MIRIKILLLKSGLKLSDGDVLAIFIYEITEINFNSNSLQPFKPFDIIIL